MENERAPLPPTRHRWPKFALAAVIVFMLLAILWVSAALRRTREQSAWSPLPGQATTNVAQ